ncbi:hypothetical protein AX660_09060 [Paraglaciecola hydrolytica]|uniref:JmjC domain-containing protein n=1 Tax=Paraglaciecola hydrolytica TaxID=1799789 RepID=A0A136A4G3_9ALTE|nr:hypothetical protein AX660_09060 [Paraglaciecola hydrolytica]
MILSTAQQILSKILTPCTYEQFFSDIVSRRPFALLSGQSPERASMLGSDPKKAILGEFEKYAHTLTCHIHTPKVPPPVARKVANAEAFQALIREYHERGYTVRLPEVIDIAPQLSEFTRALEFIFEKPVGVVIFWSEAGAAAPVHHDEIDVIVVQITGTKRWFISDEPATLPNVWKGIGEGPPPLGRYTTYDVEPGDLLYVPRGTAHTVQSTSESIHLSIGFVPVTVRDGLNAVLDHMADLDRNIRSNIGLRADNVSGGQDQNAIFEQIRAGLKKLSEQCQTDEFILQAMAKRRSRMVYDLPKLKSDKTTSTIHVNSKIKHNPLSISQLIGTADILDWCQPAEKILIHPGAEQALRFIAANVEFKVMDIPGELGDDVRIALVSRLITSGFLQAK